MARTVKCPKCGAKLKVEDDMQGYMFCPSDGTKIDLEDTLDAPKEAVDKQLELEKERIKAQKEIELKKLEVEVMKKRKEARDKKTTLIVSLGLLVFSWLMIFLGSKGFFG